MLPPKSNVAEARIKLGVTLTYTRSHFDFQLAQKRLRYKLLTGRVLHSKFARHAPRLCQSRQNCQLSGLTPFQAIRSWATVTIAGYNAPARKRQGSSGKGGSLCMVQLCRCGPKATHVSANFGVNLNSTTGTGPGPNSVPGHPLTEYTPSISSPKLLRMLRTCCKLQGTRRRDLPGRKHIRTPKSNRSTLCVATAQSITSRKDTEVVSNSQERA